MNVVIITGRLARDPELRTGNGTVCSMVVAVDRIKEGADFIRVITFGQQAENCNRYLAKGRQVAVRGHIQTGSYTSKEGQTVYTTDIVADNVEFLGSGERTERRDEEYGYGRSW